MFQDTNHRFPLSSLRLSLLIAACTLCLAAVDARAQTRTSTAAAHAPAASSNAKDVLSRMPSPCNKRPSQSRGKLPRSLLKGI